MWGCAHGKSASPVSPILFAMKLHQLNSDGDDAEFDDVRHWHHTVVTGHVHTFNLLWDDRQALRVVISAIYRWMQQELLTFGEFCHFAGAMEKEYKRVRRPKA